MTRALLGQLIRPLVPARLHQPVEGWTITECRPGDGVTLFFSRTKAIPAERHCKPSHMLLRHALSLRYGGLHPHDWRFARSGHGQLLVEAGGDEPLPRFSLSATDLFIVVALTDTGSIGVDIETLGRVSLNASRHDAWLSPKEQNDLGGLSGRPLTTELACRWTLKEALGKVEGIGLGIPLASLTIGQAQSRPVVIATGSAIPSIEQHSLSLFGCRHLIIGIARQEGQVPDGR